MERIERREYGIDYEPRRPFIPYHDRSQRFAVLVAHRRAGKTVATIQDKIKRAVISPLPHGRYAYVAVPGTGQGSCLGIPETLR
jgi:hypothetical protein